MAVSPVTTSFIISMLLIPFTENFLTIIADYAGFAQEPVASTFARDITICSDLKIVLAPGAL